MYSIRPRLGAGPLALLSGSSDAGTRPSIALARSQRPPVVARSPDRATAATAGLPCNPEETCGRGTGRGQETTPQQVQRRPFAGCAEAVQRLPQNGAAERDGLRPELRPVWHYRFGLPVLAAKALLRKAAAPQLPFPSFTMPTLLHEFRERCRKRLRCTGNGL